MCREYQCTKQVELSHAFLLCIVSIKETNSQTICLEDHPSVSKWLITMVSKSPKWGYSPYKDVVICTWHNHLPVDLRFKVSGLL